MFIPQRIKITKKCKRCQLRYGWKDKQCSHCSELTDYEVVKLKEKYHEENKGNAHLGRWFIFIAIILTIVIALL